MKIFIRKTYWKMIAVLNLLFRINRFGVFFKFNDGRQHVIHFGFQLIVNRIFTLRVYIEPARYSGSKRFGIEFTNLLFVWR